MKIGSKIGFIAKSRNFENAKEMVANTGSHLTPGRSRALFVTPVPSAGVNGYGRAQVAVNRSLTLAGIPATVYDYRLGNRSAVEWIIDQYHVSEDKRSGIRSDPNREDDPEYIVRLVGQVVRVSVETVKIVNGLPDEFEP